MMPDSLSCYTACCGFVVQRIHSSSLLKGCIIKDAVWDDKGFRLFYGDAHGRVAVANVPRVCGVCVHAFLYMYLDSICAVLGGHLVCLYPRL